MMSEYYIYCTCSFLLRILNVAYRKLHTYREDFHQISETKKEKNLEYFQQYFDDEIIFFLKSKETIP